MKTLLQLAALLIALSGSVALVIAATSPVSAAVALVGSRGRHLSWLVFLAVGGMVFYAIDR